MESSQSQQLCWALVFSGGESRVQDEGCSLVPERAPSQLQPCICRDIQGARSGQDGIGHVAHLGGAVTGLATFLMYRRGLIRLRR